MSTVLDATVGASIHHLSSNQRIFRIIKMSSGSSNNNNKKNSSRGGQSLPILILGVTHGLTIPVTVSPTTQILTTALHKEPTAVIG